MLHLLSPDILTVLLEYLDNKALLQISSTCSLFRGIVDSMQERMGHALIMPDFSKLLTYGVNLHVYEHADQVVARINCAIATNLSFRVMQTLSGSVGEILIMPMRFEFATLKLAVLVKRWLVIDTRVSGIFNRNHRYCPHNITLQCLDYTHKPTFLHIGKVDLPMTPVPRRTLLALTLHHNCMFCRMRHFTYIAIDCPGARMRKICKRCANECMVTERALLRDWSVSATQMACLRSHVLRYYNARGYYFVSWIPKEVVCHVLGIPTWPDVMMATGARRNAFLTRRSLRR